jgi:large subunit ribosomal protein L23
MVAESYRVILGPVVTEKTVGAAERDNTYTFNVVPGASKGQIRKAVEDLFGVTVLKVRTSKTRTKRRRLRGRMTASHVGKRAVVKVSPEDRIDMY